jgi:hypothetical protein
MSAVGLQSIRTGTGPSFNGSGDLFGSTIFMETNLKFAKYKRLTLNINASGHSHSRYSELIYTQAGSTAPIYSGLNLTSSNNTLGTSVSYCLLNKKFKIFVDGGVNFSRFVAYTPQSYGFYPEATTTFPTPVISINYGEQPTSHLTIGYLAALNLNYSISKSFSVGIRPSLMNDNKANIITSIPLYLGYTINK